MVMPVHGPYLLVSAIALCIECYGLALTLVKNFDRLTFHEMSIY